MSGKLKASRTARPPARAEVERGENVSILLVDDRPENLLAMSALLEGPSRTLVRAASGRDALRALLRQDFAVVLLDVNMPQMDGFETAALIRQRPASAHTPIIFVTAHGDEGQVLKAYSLGAVDYILAPVNPDVLTAKVSVFVELYRTMAANRRQADQLRRAEKRLRQQAEQQLRETDAQLQQIIDGVTDYAIFSLDLNGRIASWNASARRLFLYEEGEVLGRDADMLLAPGADASERPIEQCGRAIAEGRAEVDVWLQRRDGTRFFGNDVATPLRAADGRLAGFSKVTRDITERRRAEESLRQQAEELAEANRLKDEFLAVLSHELRTPLNAILGWSQMLLAASSDPAMLRRGLESIARNGKAQLDLVNDILDVSRFVTGKFRLDVAPFDVRTIMEAAIETGQAAANAKGISFDVVLPAGPLIVTGDASRLQQVVWNLVSNAVKFTPDGGVISLDVEADNRVVTLHVRDTGIGIAPDFLPYVFDRFRQADSSSSRVSGGLGLGLAIVRHIVELHGGTVDAHSDGHGRGSTFTVSLPVTGRAVPLACASEHEADDADSPETVVAMTSADGSPDADPPADDVLLAGVRCVVVDDDPDARYLLAAALEEHGAVVRVAETAREALAAVAEAQVLVADLAMPIEDGFWLIRRVRGLSHDRGGRVIAVALSAHAAEVDRSRSLAAGFDAHLGKPADFDRVVALVRDLLMKPHPRPALTT